MSQSSFGSWVGADETIKPPFAAVFVNHFQVSVSREIEFTYSADERCSIFLDNQFIESGPEHGCATAWFARRRKVYLTPGKHCMAVRVYCYCEPKITPYAQISIQNGFFMESHALPQLNTSGTAWQYKIISGCTFAAPLFSWGIGTKTVIDGNYYQWDILTGGGGGWKQARNFVDRRKLLDSALPPQKFSSVKNARVRFVSPLPEPEKNQMLFEKDDIQEEHQLWQTLLDGHPVRLPKGYSRRIIIDLNNYVCAYPEIVFSGGVNAHVAIAFAESLFEDAEYQEFPELSSKGNRNDIFNKYFYGDSDSFTSDGGDNRKFSSFWWSSGRYLKIDISNPVEEMHIESLKNYETGYLFDRGFAGRSSLDKLDRMVQKCFRTLEACTHDLYLDCPHYEQLMYIGDSKIETLSTYVVSADSSMPERALEMFLHSQNADGMISSYYPSWNTQIIPSFALIYCTMLHDYAMWRGNPEFIAGLLPGARKLLKYLLSCRNTSGLVDIPGWNFIDWINKDGWHNGVPPSSGNGTNSVINWLLVQALEKMAGIEKFAGNPELAKRYLNIADEISEAIMTDFFVEAKGMFADDREHRHFSEHAQIAALLTERVPARSVMKILKILEENLLQVQPNIFFMHFFFEVCAKYKLSQTFYKRLERWFDFDRHGLLTVPEQFESPRSDCHAWSSHPLYHFFATICGIRPKTFGFKHVAISPTPGTLTELHCVMPHPNGEIVVNMNFQNDTFYGDITLPRGITGELSWRNDSLDLDADGQKQTFIFKPEMTLNSYIGQQLEPVADLN